MATPIDILYVYGHTGRLNEGICESFPCRSCPGIIDLGCFAANSLDDNRVDSGPENLVLKDEKKEILISNRASYGFFLFIITIIIYLLYFC